LRGDALSKGLSVIDRKYIGHTMPVFSRSVDASRLRFFAKAIGQLDPVYIDEVAAQAAGHPALPIPPTFLLCMEGESPNPAGLRELLGLDYKRLLHGEQGFTYHQMAYAGDVLSFEQRVEDIYDKKGGALEFVVRKTRVTNQRNEHVADLRAVLVMRNQ
jgi:acyl dehydratase